MTKKLHKNSKLYSNGKRFYTTLDTQFVTDNRLSHQAKLILLYIGSQSENWGWNDYNIYSTMHIGKNTFYKAKDELIKTGYVSLKKIKKTKKIDYIYTVDMCSQIKESSNSESLNKESLIKESLISDTNNNNIISDNIIVNKKNNDNINLAEGESETHVSPSDNLNSDNLNSHGDTFHDELYPAPQAPQDGDSVSVGCSLSIDNSRLNNMDINKDSDWDLDLDIDTDFDSGSIIDEIDPAPQDGDSVSITMENLRLNTQDINEDEFVDRKSKVKSQPESKSESDFDLQINSDDNQKIYSEEMIKKTFGTAVLAICYNLYGKKTRYAMQEVDSAYYKLFD